jgi:hypothetical protein
MTDDEPQRRGDTTLNDHQGDLDAFNSDPMSRTGIIDGLSILQSVARLGDRLTDLGGWIARRLRERPAKRR